MDVGAVAARAAAPPPSGVARGDHWHRLRRFPLSFHAHALLDWLRADGADGAVRTQAEAVRAAQALMNAGLVRAAEARKEGRPFKEEGSRLYCFSGPLEEGAGHALTHSQTTPSSGAFLKRSSAAPIDAKALAESELPEEGDTEEEEDDDEFFTGDELEEEEEYGDRGGDDGQGPRSAASSGLRRRRGGGRDTADEKAGGDTHSSRPGGRASAPLSQLAHRRAVSASEPGKVIHPGRSRTVLRGSGASTPSDSGESDAEEGGEVIVSATGDGVKSGKSGGRRGGAPVVHVVDPVKLSERILASGKLRIEDRHWRLNTYRNVFTGRDLVRWLLRDTVNGMVRSTRAAVRVGTLMMRSGIFHHVTRKQHPFRNGDIFYVFSAHEPDGFRLFYDGSSGGPSADDKGGAALADAGGGGGGGEVSSDEPSGARFVSAGDCFSLKELDLVDQLKVREGAHIMVRVVEARGLRAVDKSGTSDPFVVIYLERSRMQTRTVWRSLNPQWNQHWTVSLDQTGHNLQLAVFDDNQVMSRQLLGIVFVPLHEMEVNQFDDRWWPLMPRPRRSASDTQHKVRGELRLQIYFHWTLKSMLEPLPPLRPAIDTHTRKREKFSPKGLAAAFSRAGRVWRGSGLGSVLKTHKRIVRWRNPPLSVLTLLLWTLFWAYVPVRLLPALPLVWPIVFMASRLARRRYLGAKETCKEVCFRKGLEAGTVGDLRGSKEREEMAEMDNLLTDEQRARKGGGIGEFFRRIKRKARGGGGGDDDDDDDAAGVDGGGVTDVDSDTPSDSDDSDDASSPDDDDNDDVDDSNSDSDHNVFAKVKRIRKKVERVYQKVDITVNMAERFLNILMWMDDRSAGPFFALLLAAAVLLLVVPLRFLVWAGGVAHITKWLRMTPGERATKLAGKKKDISPIARLIRRAPRGQEMHLNAESVVHELMHARI